MDPCEIMCRVIDDYFYGSVEINNETQKNRNEMIKQATNAPRVPCKVLLFISLSFP